MCRASGAPPIVASQPERLNAVYRCILFLSYHGRNSASTTVMGKPEQEQGMLRMNETESNRYMQEDYMLNCYTHNKSLLKPLPNQRWMGTKREPTEVVSPAATSRKVP
jgi:hypothetical protein